MKENKNNNSFVLKLEEPTFDDFRIKFNEMVQNVITNMRSKDVEAASITAKFDIAIVESDNPNTSAPDSLDEQTDLIPMVKYKLTATMQTKSEASGGFGGVKYALVWNRLKHAYELVPRVKNKPEYDEDQVSAYDYISSQEAEGGAADE